MEAEMEIISLLSHAHILRLSRLDEEGETCKICEKELLSPFIYCCEKCHLFICRSCAKLPQKIQHPFHPQHTLVLNKLSLFSCSLCDFLDLGLEGRLDSGYAYECNECEFNLHLKCFALKPASTNEGRALQCHRQHFLIACDKPPDYTYECFRCDACIADDHLYVCLKCRLFLDQWCASQPNEIRHPFHIEHPLKLQAGDPFAAFECSLCRSYDTAVYSCFLCNFNVDVHCATLMPTPKDSDPDQVQSEIQCATHPHPLIQCYSNMRNFARQCYGCGLPFEDAIDVCLPCGILLHKSCADLPREIFHPFHPQHSLTLYENSIKMKIYYSSHCKGCGKGTGWFVYICRACDFLLDLRCATAKFPTIISELHPHALAFCDIETKQSKCNICSSNCSKFFFRCVHCNFNIHDHCYPSLPLTIKHDCHCDPLTFTTCQIKDYPHQNEKQEFYCNACEETRNLAHPTYFCEECHFVAHVHCVISEILPHLKRDSKALEDRAEASTSGLKGDDAMLQSASTAQSAGDANIDAEIAALVDEIDAMMEELRELLENRYQQVSHLLYKVRNQAADFLARQGEEGLSRRYGEADQFLYLLKGILRMDV